MYSKEPSSSHHTSLLNLFFLWKPCEHWSLRLKTNVNPAPSRLQNLIFKWKFTHSTQRFGILWAFRHWRHCLHREEAPDWSFHSITVFTSPMTSSISWFTTLQSSVDHSFTKPNFTTVLPIHRLHLFPFSLIEYGSCL